MKKAHMLAAYGGTEINRGGRSAEDSNGLKRNQHTRWYVEPLLAITVKVHQLKIEPRQPRWLCWLFRVMAAPINLVHIRMSLRVGWKALIKKQDAEGNFFFTGGHHHRLYTHAQATIALCELYGMTKDETLKAPAQKALAYCLSASQSPQGGWRYAPGGASDTSVTGWFVMALQEWR